MWAIWLIIPDPITPTPILPEECIPNDVLRDPRHLSRLSVRRERPEARWVAAQSLPSLREDISYKLGDGRNGSIRPGHIYRDYHTVARHSGQ